MGQSLGFRVIALQGFNGRYEGFVVLDGFIGILGFHIVGVVVRDL